MRPLLVPLAATIAFAALIVAVAQAAPDAEPITSKKKTPTPRPDPRALPGWSNYDRLCLPCHGSAGDGHGPAASWLWPRPRDLTLGDMKWRSTEVGDPALDLDLTDTMRHGVPGTSMPAFGATLDQAALAELVAVIRAFGPSTILPRQALTLPAQPAGGGDAVRGAALWTSAGCAHCHGEGGRGDGLAAATLVDADGQPAAPYDLTTQPLRRPRAGDRDADVSDALARSIAWGLAGTAMPGYAQALPGDDLWAVVAFVDELRWRGAPVVGPGPLAAPAIALDDALDLTRAGYWAGVTTAADDAERAPFGGTIALQGEPPESLAPAQASLSSRQCGRCHAKQVREWTGSVHSKAASPGLLAQVMRLDKGAKVESCMRCHAPLAEQQPVIRPGQEGGDDTSLEYRTSPYLDESLRDEGLTCAACHVRGWTRHGPATVSDSLLALPEYPAEPLALYERADFCMPCHQLPPRLAVAGRPLLDTYREWLAGPYMKRGVQCQHCHMPNREHSFKGIHDPDTFREGIRVEAIAARGGSGVVSVRARVWNVGAGHYLPTTPTPAAWLTVELVDAGGKLVAGARAEQRIGRHIAFRDSAWTELEDTRIPPGESIEVASGWKKGRVAEATHAKITVRVAPDDYYEGLYAVRLKSKLAPEVRALFEEALERAQGSHYVAEELMVEIEETGDRGQAAGNRQ